MRRPPDPFIMLNWLTEVLEDLHRLGFEWTGKRVMEVGTGWRAQMPLFFYLLGAGRVDTFDLHRYLKEELTLGSLQMLLPREAEAWKLFEPWVEYSGWKARWDALPSVATLEDFFRVTGIHYHAPVDAAHTDLPDHSIDLHFSYTVFEHIPGPVLVSILREASRVVKTDGIICHHIDPSDHFSHFDSSISQINFLQYTEAEWSRYNDNQFAYHNRLRIGDYEQIYRDADQDVMLLTPRVDARSLQLIKDGFPLAEPYRAETPERIATTVVRICSRARTTSPV